MINNMMQFLRSLSLVSILYLSAGSLIIGASGVNFFVGGHMFTPAKEKSFAAQGKKHGIGGSSYRHK